MSKKISSTLIDFFGKNPHLRPSKEGTLGIIIGDKSYLLEYKDQKITIREIKREKIKSLILHITKKSFYSLFSSESVDVFYENLIHAVLNDKNLYLETSDLKHPMKNVFFKILSINRGKMGINRYELMIPLI